MAGTVYWDNDNLDLTNFGDHGWVDDAVEYFAYNHKAGDLDSVIADEDDGSFVLTVANPYTRKPAYRVVLRPYRDESRARAWLVCSVRKI